MDDILFNISDEWLNIIYKDETKDILDNIYENLKLEIINENITPNKNDWFNWCRLTKLKDIKAIIVGQDVYPTKGHAHGLSFSCIGNIPKSLNNIYKCLLKCNEINKIPNHGDLSTWATQGVLMLNIGLTTKIKVIGSHIKLWEKYVYKIIERVCEYHYNENRQLIFMLWGNFAKKVKKYVDTDFHIILEWLHPSPLAQHSKNKNLNFIHCDHFTNVNKILISDEEIAINWNSINDEKVFSERKISEIKEENNKVENILNMNNTHHIAFTDGSAFPNNKSIKSRAGWAACFVSGFYKNKILYGNLDINNCYASNIRAEGYAIIRVMEKVDESNIEWTKLTIITDCMFWIDMIENYMRKWKLDMFDEKSNPDLTKRMWFIYNKLILKGEVKFMHIKSHNKDGWRDYDKGTFEKFCFDKNEYVDKMCNHARLNLKLCEEIIANIE